MSEEVKQIEELLAEGGIFYSLGGQSWCDTTLDSWYLVPGKGFVRAEPEDVRDEEQEEGG